ncbi:ATP-binding protein [Planctomicrobium sp. SH668]|uniref:sensor histidine kinase n=1 Tax=Planctomicrobium sp. SH668 TaxID=3448126 RepID=UPI003F5AF6B6
MRWPIRNQILLPLISIQLLIVAGVTSLAANTALKRVEQQVTARFEGLHSALTHKAYPLTQAVLSQMKELSGAELLVHRTGSNVVESTLPDLAGTAVTDDLAKNHVSATDQIHSITLNRVEYLAKRVPTFEQGVQTSVLVLYPLELVESARSDAVRIPILSGILTLLFTSIAVILVASRMGRRIQGIERQVAQIAGGQFDQIPLATRDDELRDLSESVNQMSVHLDQLTKHQQEAERARLIKQLIGGIAHQLRNSLTGARLAVQVHQRRCDLETDDSLNVTLRQLALTEEQIRGLVGLIRDEKRAHVKATIGAIAQDVERLVRPMCEHRQIRFSLVGTDCQFEIEDADQLRAALLNLCINAVEATSNGGKVSVSLTSNDESVTIDVRDNGPGIPDADVSRMFEAFQTSKAEGMGLGLTLVRQTAQNLNGSITYQRDADETLFRMICRKPNVSRSNQWPEFASRSYRLN